jgi:hypothetical protein
MMDDAAIGYTRLGWPVIPLHTIRDRRCTCGRSICDSPGKHPRLAAWPSQATTDARTIRDWWARWPAANVGIVTGNGLVVLDSDPRHGGDTSLAELERAHGPETVRVLTGGGGLHLYFAVDQPIGNRAGLAPGIDLRGDGGFVVAPPSLHASGRRYAWELGASPDDVPLAPVPGWLLDRLRASMADRLRVDGAPLVIHEGQRNHRLHQLASLLRRYGLGERAILGCLEVINREHATPPLDPGEVAHIAASAARYAPASPSRAGTGDPEDEIVARSPEPAGADG